jgi:hypothetical protein
MIVISMITAIGTASIERSVTSRLLTDALSIRGEVLTGC